LAEELTLSIDPVTGEYTRLTRFLAGADTSPFDGKSHTYPEEVFIVSGRLYDMAFALWLEAGHYASRPPGEVHGPFKTDVGCVVQGSGETISRAAAAAAFRLFDVGVGASLTLSDVTLSNGLAQGGNGGAGNWNGGGAADLGGAPRQHPPKRGCPL
jgi:hypothetical protein